jgi:hypothetical protein
VDAELVRRGGELHAAPHDGLAVVDGRHQLGLGVDDEQRAVFGLAENRHRPPPRKGPFWVIVAASSQSSSAYSGELRCS